MYKDETLGPSTGGAGGSPNGTGRVPRARRILTSAESS